MSRPDELYRLEPHVCLVCFGPVLSRKDQGERRLFRCGSCGVEGVGTPRSICACGSRIATRDAGIRCVPNPNPTPECPALIVAREIS